MYSILEKPKEKGVCKQKLKVYMYLNRNTYHKKSALPKYN